jgi:hypothetical protein
LNEEDRRRQVEERKRRLDVAYKQQELNQQLGEINRLIISGQLEPALAPLAEVEHLAFELKMNGLVKELRSKIEEIAAVVQSLLQERIHAIVLELGVKFPRLQLAEIGEKCGVFDEQYLISAIQKLIDQGQVAAEIFLSTQSVVFDQRTNIHLLHDTEEILPMEPAIDLAFVCEFCGARLPRLDQPAIDIMCPDCGRVWQLVDFPLHAENSTLSEDNI